MNSENMKVPNKYLAPYSAADLDTTFHFTIHSCLNRDAPCLGGIFVEILHDTSFRLVPATINELHTMIREVKGYPLLAGARGHATVDIDSLIHYRQLHGF